MSKFMDSDKLEPVDVAEQLGKLCRALASGTYAAKATSIATICEAWVDLDMKRHRQQHANAPAAVEQLQGNDRRCIMCEIVFVPTIQLVNNSALEAAAMLAGFCSSTCMLDHAMQTVNGRTAWWQK